MYKDIHPRGFEIRGDEMRESFVFHAEYIEDLPEEYKTRFIEYTVNYGLSGRSPEIEDGTLESTVWKKIARRIDTEAEKYRITSERRKEAALRRYGKVYGEQKTEKTAETKSDEPPKEPKKNFEKPTVEEIAAYCAERKNEVDAQAFFDFYESKGWKVGAVKMRDWRASVRTWEKRDAEEKKARSRSKTIWNDGTTDADTEVYENMF